MLVKVELVNLLFWDVRAGNIFLVLMLRLRLRLGWKQTLAAGRSIIVSLVNQVQIPRLVVKMLSRIHIRMYVLFF